MKAGDIVINERGEVGKLVMFEGRLVSAYLPPFDWDPMQPYDGLIERQLLVYECQEGDK